MALAIAGFLPAWLIDTATVFGVGGTVATLYGLYLTWRQVLLTKQAAEAARDAAVESERRMRRQYLVYLVSDSHRSLSEIVIHVDHEDWRSAALRMSDLAEKMGVLGQMRGTAAFPAVKIARELRNWPKAAGRKTTHQESAAFSNAKWEAFVQRLQQLFDEYRGPFGSIEEGRSE